MVFLLSIAAAVLLVRVYAAPALRGADIIEQMRQNGLGNYYKKPSASFYIRNRQFPYEWSVEKTEISDSQFEYTKIIKPSNALISEQLQSALDISTSKYTGIANINRPDQITTEITLSSKDKTVTVTKSIGRHKIQVTSRMPSNYIPKEHSRWCWRWLIIAVSPLALR